MNSDYCLFDALLDNNLCMLQRVMKEKNALTESLKSADAARKRFDEELKRYARRRNMLLSVRHILMGWNPNCRLARSLRLMLPFIFGVSSL